MKRSRTQAIYKFLPGLWIDFRDKDDKRFGSTSYSIFINQWNTEPLKGVYTSRIHDEISRQIGAFERRGGDAKAFIDHKKAAYFHFVEASWNEGIGQIRGVISPTVFYCSSCGHVIEEEDDKKLIPPKHCSVCKGTMNQLQMVYTCECGFATGMRVPRWPRGGDGRKVELIYDPSQSNYRFEYEQGHNRSFIEMGMRCECGAWLRPDNAAANTNFIPAIVNSVNLINENEGLFFEYGPNSKKIVLGKWIGAITDDVYDKVVKNPMKFEGADSEDEKEYEMLKASLIENGDTAEQAEAIVKAYKAKKKKDAISIPSLAAKAEAILPEMSDESLLSLASEFIEFNTIKNAKDRITLAEAVEQSIKVETISGESEIKELNKRLGISSAQLSFDIELISSAFGFTRKRADPSSVDNGKTLNLCNFGRDRDGVRVFCSTLETEGILIELDRSRIIQWMLDNNLLESVALPNDDEVSVKKWFLENVDSTSIDTFSEIDRKNKRLKTTYYVYALLHTISHALIRSAGVLSGLDKNSLSELIFPNVPAIFIYANSSQGVPLGGLSGMFEQNYKAFLERALVDNQTCVFDPICSSSNSSKGAACNGCVYLAEVSCCHFNRDLDRLLLYGSPDTERVMKKGFWG